MDPGRVTAARGWLRGGRSGGGAHGGRRTGRRCCCRSVRSPHERVDKQEGDRRDAEPEACGRDRVLRQRRDIAIWPRGATRGGTIPLVSPATGLIGYPMAMAGGLKLRTLFNPALHMGGRFRLETSLKGISGIWTISQVTESLAAEMPEGPGSAMSAPIRWPLAAAASDPPRHRAAPTRAAG